MKRLALIACICGILMGGISFVAAQSEQIPRSYLPLIIRGDGANPEPPDGTTTPTPTLDPSVTPSITPTMDPAATPTLDPSVTPSTTPTMDPVATPTITQTLEPSVTPPPGDATATPTPPPGDATPTPTTIPFPEIDPIGGVINGDFEQGPFEWGDPDHNEAIIRDEFAHNVEPVNGEWMAMFDSESMFPKELTRDIQVPRDATHFGLQTWIVSSKAECQQDPDRLVIFLSRDDIPVNNKTIALCERTSEDQWKLHWLGLPEDVRGKTINIRIFANSEEGMEQSTVYVDDVTFGKAKADS
ncbi:MAG: hypothetical protein AAGF95_05670 [Chloroflexota bacterium]